MHVEKQTFLACVPRHLFVSHELSSYFLNTIHNIFFYNNLLETIREEIQKGSFKNFYEITKLNGSEVKHRMNIAYAMGSQRCRTGWQSVDEFSSLSFYLLFFISYSSDHSRKGQNSKNSLLKI